MPDIQITSIDLEKLKDIGRNSQVTLKMEQIAAKNILRNIVATAPYARPAYRDGVRDNRYAYKYNFRIEHRQFPKTRGYVSYIIAGRFQWNWIEYGWTNWRTEKKYRGKYIMTNALRAYGFGPDYGKGVRVR